MFATLLRTFRRRTDPILLLVTAAFLISLLPFAATYLLHYPDERHYTDGGIWMVQRGDLLVPRTAEGLPRLRKPVLTYWLVAASYRLFGISPFTSRLPFVLAGCGVVLLTFQLARLVSGSRRGGLTAAAIVACHPVLMTTSVFAIPDVLLCLFLLLTIYGFVGLLVEERPRSLFCWAAYVGAGLAAATKGLPIVALLMLAWTFALANPWRRLPVRRLVNVPSMLLGAVIGIGWYAVLLVMHGPTCMKLFWLDQAAGRLAPNPLETLVRVPAATLLFLSTFFVWIVPYFAIWRCPKSQDSNDSRQTAALFLLWTWTLSMMVLVGVLRNLSVRYILYAAPCWAVILAAAFCRIDVEMLNRWLRRMLAFTYVGMVLFLAFGTMCHLQLGSSVVTVGMLFGCAVPATFLWIVGNRRGGLMPTVCLSCCVLLIFPLTFVLLQSVALPDQGTQIAQSLQACGVRSAQQVCLVGTPALVGKVRVCSGGKIYRHARYFSRELLSDYDVVVFCSRSAVTGTNLEHELLDASKGFKDVDFFGLLKSLWHGRVGDYLADHRMYFKMLMTTP